MQLKTTVADITQLNYITFNSVLIYLVIGTRLGPIFCIGQQKYCPHYRHTDIVKRHENDTVVEYIPGFHSRTKEF